MNYRGRVKGNIIVIEGDARVPEGAEVVITLVPKNQLAEYAGVLPAEDAEELRQLILEMRQQQLVEEQI